MKFSLLTSPSIKNARQVSCEADFCAWWDAEEKECHVATVGKFVKSIYKEHDNANVASGVLPV
jgi:hypothetical protein